MNETRNVGLNSYISGFDYILTYFVRFFVETLYLVLIV